MIRVPQLWASSIDQNMFKSALIVILKNLVVAVREDSIQMHEFLEPLIHNSVDVSQPNHVYMIDDGLELWLALSQSSNIMTKSLLNVGKYLSILIENGSDTLSQVLKILESNMILDPISLLDSYGLNIFKSLVYLLTLVRPEASMKIITCIENCIRACARFNCTRLVFEITSNSGLLKFLTDFVCNDKEFPNLSSRFCNILARLAIHHPNLLIEIIPNNLQLIDSWIDKVDYIGNSKDRKLAALALGSLINFTSSRVHQIFVVLAGVVVDAVEDGGLIYWTEQRGEDEESPGGIRKSALNECDLVYSVNIVAFVKELLLNCRNSFEQVNGVGSFQVFFYGNQTYGLALEPLMKI